MKKHFITDSAIDLVKLHRGKRHVHTLLYRVPRVKVVAVCSTEPSEIQWAQENEYCREFGIAVYQQLR